MGKIHFTAVVGQEVLQFQDCVQLHLRKLFLKIQLNVYIL